MPDVFEPVLSAPPRVSYFEQRVVSPASRERAWHALTCPVALAQWAAREHSGFTDLQLRPVVRSEWQYTFDAEPEGFTFRGDVREVVEGERLCVFEEGGTPDAQGVQICANLSDAGEGGCGLVVQVLYVSETERDRSLAAGYGDGIGWLVHLLARYVSGDDVCGCMPA